MYGYRSSEDRLKDIVDLLEVHCHYLGLRDTAIGLAIGRMKVQGLKANLVGLDIEAVAASAPLLTAQKLDMLKLAIVEFKDAQRLQKLPDGDGDTSEGVALGRMANAVKSMIS